jgi:hypothetical protein
MLYDVLGVNGSETSSIEFLSPLRFTTRAKKDVRDKAVSKVLSDACGSVCGREMRMIRETQR